MTDPRRNDEASSVYGPVFSWRFGRSLGIDPLLVDSICSFSCVYCQLGKIHIRTMERKVWVETARIMSDLRESRWRGADVVTLSGSGEPTLAANLREIILGARSVTSLPEVVLTNGSTLLDPAVRADLCFADHVCCKLDAPSPSMLRRTNRPMAGITLDGVVEGIRLLRAEHPGKVSLQIMLLPSSLHEIDSFVRQISTIAPDSIHLSLPSRQVPEAWLRWYRGEHQWFDSERAFSLLDHELVDHFARELSKRTGIVTHTPDNPVKRESANV